MALYTVRMWPYNQVIKYTLDVLTVQEEGKIEVALKKVMKQENSQLKHSEERLPIRAYCTDILVDIYNPYDSVYL